MAATRTAVCIVESMTESDRHLHMLQKTICFIFASAFAISISLCMIVWTQFGQNEDFNCSSVDSAAKAASELGSNGSHPIQFMVTANDAIHMDTPVFTPFVVLNSTFRERQLALVALLSANTTKWQAKFNVYSSPIPPRHYRFTKPKSKAAMIVNYWLEPSFLNASRVRQDQLRHAVETRRLPVKFDARHRWPDCYGLSQAHSVVSMASDRLCIQTNGKRQLALSVSDMLECCEECRGCEGTDTLLQPLFHFARKGVVTGGDYGTYEGCKPYPYPAVCGAPCPITNLMHAGGQRLTCRHECSSRLYGRAYGDDLVKGQEVYSIGHSLHHELVYDFLTKTNDSELIVMRDALMQNPGKKDYAILLDRLIGMPDDAVPVPLPLPSVTNSRMIMHEILERGPVVTCFRMTEDFQVYDSGIYHYVIGEPLYAHCVKILGWGVEKGVNFWQVSNSWGRTWGEHGFFRVVRGENVNGFETDVYGVVVSVA